MVKKISKNEFEQVKNDEIAVIDFSAEWCGPCKMLAPVMEEVSEEFGDSVSFYNIDVDENMDIAQMYKIVSIPALILLKKGENVDMQIGFQPEDGVVSFIKSHLG